MVIAYEKITLGALVVLRSAMIEHSRCKLGIRTSGRRYELMMLRCETHDQDLMAVAEKNDLDFDPRIYFYYDEDPD